MAVANSLPDLLASLTQSLTLAQEGTSKISTIEHPKDGISLLDVKNELLLSYLQNLVFLILVKLRNSKPGANESGGQQENLDDAVRAKLIELRLYLEKGARPLEEKLRFSIERFLRTAEEANRKEKIKEIKQKGKTGSSTDEDSEDGLGLDRDDDEDSDDGEHSSNLRHKPGKLSSAAPNLGTLIDDVAIRTVQRDDDTDAPPGIYRPPRRERQLMETTQSKSRDKSARRPMRSHTMDEFVTSELSSAPIAEPSIGTTIVEGGRRMKTTKEREVETERREYEETNFVRLPKESKKERAKKAKQEGRGRMQFGGEEWHNLGEGVERIDKMTRRKEGGAGSGVRALLEKSRKRGIDTTDGPRGSGHQIGETFRNKARMLEGGRRDRGRGR